MTTLPFRVPLASPVLLMLNACGEFACRRPIPPWPRDASLRLEMVECKLGPARTNKTPVRGISLRPWKSANGNTRPAMASIRHWQSQWQLNHFFVSLTPAIAPATTVSPSVSP